MPKVKLQDIAHICGVDISTVSRGMRGDPRVKPKTRKQIEETAHRLGYRPNLIARNLAGGKTSTLWIILPSVDASIDHRLVRHASHAAAKHGYTLFAALHDCDNFGTQSHNDLANYERVLEMAAQGTTDGLLIIPRRGADDVALLQDLVREEFPMVFLDNFSESLPNPVVTTDNKTAARILTENCLKAGATGVILLFGEHNPVARARLAGARSALEGARSVRYINQSQWEAEPDVAAQGLGDTVAIIGSSQSGHIQPLTDHYGAKLTSSRLLFGVFDQWTGATAPAQKVFVALQDCETLAQLAVERLIALIEGRPITGERVQQIPAQVMLSHAVSPLFISVDKTAP